MLRVLFNQCIVYSKMCWSFCLCSVVCLYKAIVCVCECVCVRVCLFSQCVNNINPRQGFNNYKGTGLCGRGFFILDFFKNIRFFGNAELDPSIIGVGFKKHDIMPSSIHRSAETLGGNIERLHSGEKKTCFAISSDSTAAACAEMN